MYRPVLYVNDAVDAYPAPLGRGAREFRDLVPAAKTHHGVKGSTVFGAVTAPHESRPRLTMRASLDGDTVHFSYHWVGGAATGLTIRTFPGYGILWRSLHREGSTLSFVADPFSLTGVRAPDEQGAATTIRPVGETRLASHDRDDQFGLQTVELSAPSGGRDVHFDVTVRADASAHRTSTFSQRSLIRRFDISDVVLWKDTGWLPRLAGDACFDPTQETQRLAIFHVRPACRAG